MELPRASPTDHQRGTEVTKGINHYEGKAKRRQRLRNKDRDVFKSRYYQRQQRQIRDNYFADTEGLEEELYFYDEE